jgi:hypothetical protein
MTASPPAAVPSRRIVTERRDRPFRIGIWCAIVGLLLLVVGAIAFSAQQTIRTVGGDKAFLGSAVTFDADQRSYDILGIRPPTVADDVFDTAVANITCEVTLADGTQLTVDHDDVSLATSTDIGVLITRFDAVPGPTTVLCDWERRPISGAAYSVATSHRLFEFISLGVIGMGILVGLVGSYLIAIGVRGRQRIIDPA